MFPFSISFRGMPSSHGILRRVRKRILRLALFHHKIISCRLVISSPELVNLHVELPKDSLTVSRGLEKRASRQAMSLAIRDAFNTLERRLAEKANILKRGRARRRSRRLLREVKRGWFEAAPLATT